MHRHQYSGRKFNREAGPRKALFRGLASQLILYEKVTTTLEKAKEIRPIVEKLITRAKSGTLADRRIVEKFLSFKDRSSDKLFTDLGPLYKERKGGYTRIIKIPNRVGDNAKMAIISLLDTEKLTKKAIEESQKSKVKSTNENSKKSKPEAKIKKVPDKKVKAVNTKIGEKK